MDSPLAELTAQEGARRVALGYLDQAVKASERLDEADALHQFRVGMRRLRSCLRAYDDVLGDELGKKLRKRLKAVAASTNPGRDAEVQLECVLTLGDTEGEHERHGVLWLAERLRAEKDQAYAKVRDEILAEFAKVEAKLRPALSSYVVKRRVGQPPPGDRFGAVAARALEAAFADLRVDLSEVKSIADEAIAHRARIHGKRLRYLVEPFRGEVEGAKDLVKSLKAIQDLLGDLNDLHNLSETVGQALEESSLERARTLRELAMRVDDSLREELATDREPGLLRILERTQADRVKLFDALLNQWLTPGGRLDALERDLAALQGRLRGAEDDVEIERKYLLLGLPEACRGTRARLLEQGYLPGERLIERVRKITDGSQAKFLRTVKLGAGVRRVEVEEACSAEIFDALWALTEGKRVRKRRYVVPDGDLAWEIDEFLDRELVLAEIELPSEDTEIAVPEWLAPYIVREVTDESAYVNANLAQ